MDAEYQKRVLELKLANNQDLLSDVAKERAALDQRWDRLQDERQLIVESLKVLLIPEQEVMQ